MFHLQRRCRRTLRERWKRKQWINRRSWARVWTFLVVAALSNIVLHLLDICPKILLLYMLFSSGRNLIPLLEVWPTAYHFRSVSYLPVRGILPLKPTLNSSPSKWSMVPQRELSNSASIIIGHQEISYDALANGVDRLMLVFYKLVKSIDVYCW